MKTKVKHFKEGGTLIYQKRLKRYTVIYMGFYFGKRREKYNEATAHFLEHMLFKETKKRKYEDFKKESDEIFSWHNAFTSQDYMFYTFKRANQLVENCFEFASDCLLNSTLKPEHIETEKRVILEELARAKDDNERKFYIAQMQCFGNDVEINSVLGNEKDIKSIDRKELKAFRDKEFTKNNFLMTVVGGISFRKAKKLAEKYLLSHLKSSPKNEIYNSCIEAKKSGNLLIEKKELARAYGCVTFKLDNVNMKDIEICSLLSTALNKQYGKFYGTLRAKGLIYTAGVGYSHSSKLSDFSFKFQCTPQNINPIIDEIAKLIKDLKQNGLSNEQLKTLRQEKQINKNEKVFDPRNRCYQLIHTFLDIGETALGEKYKKERKKLYNNIEQKDIINFSNNVFSKKENIYITILSNINKNDIYSYKEIQNKLTEK